MTKADGEGESSKIAKGKLSELSFKRWTDLMRDISKVRHKKQEINKELMRLTKIENALYKKMQILWSNEK